MKRLALGVLMVLSFVVSSEAVADGRIRLVIANQVFWSSDKAIPAGKLEQRFEMTRVNPEYSIDGRKWESTSPLYAGERRVRLFDSLKDGWHTVTIRGTNPSTGESFVAGPFRKKVRAGKETTWRFTISSAMKADKLICWEKDFGKLRITASNNKKFTVTPMLSIDNGSWQMLAMVKANRSVKFVTGSIPSGWHKLRVRFLDASGRVVTTEPFSKYIYGGRMTDGEVIINQPLI